VGSLVAPLTNQRIARAIECPDATVMKIAMALNFYFPYGGLQRDFARIAQEALHRGHQVVALVEDWQGEPLEGVEIRCLNVPARSNHVRIRRFSRAIAEARASGEFDRVLGFNRLEGLDVYFAADSCFAQRLQGWRRVLGWLPRYATYLQLERQVVAPNGPLMLFLNKDQCVQYQHHYPLNPQRYCLLPPGIEESRRQPANHIQVRTETRAQLGVSEDEILLMFLGSGFRIKGLDRALKAFAAQREKVRLIIVGNDEAAPYLAQLPTSVRNRIQVLGARDDVPALMQAADLLLHPAYRESAGMVLLEATVAGLPVLTTDTCGYARYIREAGSGLVVTSPFRQDRLNSTLQQMIEALPGDWQQEGLRYAENPQLYRLPATVMDYTEEYKR